MDLGPRAFLLYLNKETWSGESGRVLAEQIRLLRRRDWKIGVRRGA